MGMKGLISGKTILGKTLEVGSIWGSDYTGLTQKVSSVTNPEKAKAADTTAILPATQEISTKQSYQDLARSQMRRNSFLSSIYSGSAASMSANKSGKLGG